MSNNKPSDFIQSIAHTTVYYCVENIKPYKPHISNQHINHCTIKDRISLNIHAICLGTDDRKIHIEIEYWDMEDDSQVIIRPDIELTNDYKLPEGWEQIIHDACIKMMTAHDKHIKEIAAEHNRPDWLDALLL